MSGQAAQVLALIAQSIALQHGGQQEAALACLDQALALAPGFPTALIKRGTLLQAMGRSRAALADFDHCLDSSPAMSHVLALRDAALQAALQELDGHLHAAPDLCERAALRERVGRNEEALADFRSATELDPGCHAAWNGMGNLLLRLNRQAEALNCYQAILAFAPDDVIALFNSGNVLQQEARYEDALACYDRALAARPGFAEIMMEQAHCRLAQGDWQSGWPLFEARWNTVQLKNATLPTVAPCWRGEHLPHASLLLWAEQGLGDTLQFVRYVPLVAERVGHVVLRVPASLLSLLACLANERVTVISQDQALPSHDLHCPLMSLPLAFATIPQTIPHNIPYLSVPFDSASKWRNLLGERGNADKPRIGLAWAGGQRRLNNPTRDIPPVALLPLLEFDADWFSLQKDHAPADVALLAQYPQVRRMEQCLDDFSDTAALIKELDLVISVDTAVGHLAGALGKPVWLLLRKAGEWRWQIDPARSPWYPQHRLFRQLQHGDWRGPVQQLAGQLPHC